MWPQSMLGDVFYGSFRWIVDERFILIFLFRSFSYSDLVLVPHILYLLMIVGVYHILDIVELFLTLSNGLTRIV